MRCQGRPAVARLVAMASRRGLSTTAAASSLGTLLHRPGFVDHRHRHGHHPTRQRRLHASSGQFGPGPGAGSSSIGVVGFPGVGYRYPERPSEVVPPLEESARDSAALLASASGEGPEPSYQPPAEGGYKQFVHGAPFQCEIKDNPRDGVLPSGFTLAYESWGELNASKTNVILVHTGLSASSHARSTEVNPAPGWWEGFIGPGLALDTDQFHVICCNVLGGCFGSTGPSSIDPETGVEYAMSFPMITISDMVRAQFMLLDSLGIQSLHAAVGASMGGMQALAAAAMYPNRVCNVVSISAGCQAHPTSIALRYMQRRVLMADPHWNGGQYYGGPFPVMGIKHAREIATISYRSGPEWEQRFGRRKAKQHGKPAKMSFHPEYLIETYLDHQGNSWCGRYDPNSLLYISKAMDAFDMADGHLSLAAGVAQVQCPALVIGVQSDILFPVEQQRQIVDLLRDSGHPSVTYYELNAIYGHDTFLLEVPSISTALRGHLGLAPNAA